MLRRLNDSLPGLVLGIVLYGAVLQIVLLLLPVEKLTCSIGLWYGIVIAAGMAINLASVIYDSVMLRDEKSARARAILKSILRYVAVCLLFFVLGLFRFGNLYTAVFGVMGLKVSAYLQPVLAKISWKLVGENSIYPFPKEFPEEAADDTGFNEQSEGAVYDKQIL